MNTKDRFVWAVDLLNVYPDDQLAEIGCGTGILLELIGRKLSAGKIIGIDSSAAMISSAKKRAGQLMEEGKAALVQTELKKFKVETDLYNKVLAFNVNVFWRNGVPELGIVKKMLAAKGLFYLFYQPPAEDLVQPILAKALEQLESNGFTIKEIIQEKFHPASAFCIVSKADTVKK